MAIPNAFESDQLREVQTYFEELDLSDLLPLNREDTFLIGAFVQIFNFIELNLRRAIELFCDAGLIKRKKHFHTSELVSCIKIAVVKLDYDKSELDDLLGKLTEIEYRRPFRNLFAHWAGRRVPGHDSIVLLSMDTKDAVTALGENTLTKDYCAYSIMMIHDIKGLLLHISKYDEWLAQITSAWHTQLSGRPAMEKSCLD